MQSFLLGPTKMIAISLCNDATIDILSESTLLSKAAFEKQFECEEGKYQPTDLKVIDVVRDEQAIINSQIAYIDTKDKKMTMLSLRQSLIYTSWQMKNSHSIAPPRH